MAIIYPKIASRPEGYDRQKSYIALLMTEAAFFSGAKDPQQFLKKLEKLLPPDTSVEGGNENTWGPFSNVAEKLNAHKEWGEERFLQYIGETYILKDKKRAEIHENYKYLPEYLRKFVEQFEAKLEEEREAKLKQNAR